MHGPRGSRGHSAAGVLSRAVGNSVPSFFKVVSWVDMRRKGSAEDAAQRQTDALSGLGGNSGDFFGGVGDSGGASGESSKQVKAPHQDVLISSQESSLGRSSQKRAALAPRMGWKMVTASTAFQPSLAPLRQKNARLACNSQPIDRESCGPLPPTAAARGSLLCILAQPET